MAALMGGRRGPARRRRTGRAVTPTVLQMEEAECGAAALGIVLGYHGRIAPLEELRVACDVSRDGSKASSIVKAARSYGLLARGLKVEPGRARALPTPFIAFWDSYHFVVVEGFARGKVYLNDPTTGPRVVSDGEFARSFSAVALTFEPGPDFRRGGARQGTMSLLRGWLRGAAPALLLVVLLSAVLALLGLAAPVAGRIFVDRYLTGGAAGGRSRLPLASASRGCWPRCAPGCSRSPWRGCRPGWSSLREARCSGACYGCPASFSPNASPASWARGRPLPARSRRR